MAEVNKRRVERTRVRWPEYILLNVAHVDCQSTAALAAKRVVIAQEDLSYFLKCFRDHQFDPIRDYQSCGRLRTILASRVYRSTSSCKRVFRKYNHPIGGPPGVQKIKRRSQS